MERLSAGSARTGRSVAALVRGAIDLAFPDDQRQREGALLDLLVSTEGDTEFAEEPEFDVDAYLAQKVSCSH